ncbi:tautomerase family protein [Megasphaera massiliensis]|uniref:tautomerase family protein n=1 Tax=Megasphaera massiliensis TaxID=1232428 RepID=UPI000408D196|nr:tautomerase family protein [Megasphaera massiliensis]
MRTIKITVESRKKCLTSLSKPIPKTKKRVVEQIRDVLLKTWGCPEEAITISVEEFPPEDFDKKVRELEILPKLDNMMILDGKKQYK